MNTILQQLAGGDRRSIGAVPQVVDAVLSDDRLFPTVFDGMRHADPVVRMRCADAVEKISARRPELLAHKAALLALAESAGCKLPTSIGEVGNCGS